MINEHFANISSSVQLNHVSDPPNWERMADYVDSKLPSGVPYCIPSISKNFVRTSLQQLSTSKATGLDDLSSFFLKTAASSISPSLTAVFNPSNSSGVFPDLWKTAKVSPLHKDGSFFDRSNYRPISVLAVVSKILERHVHQTFYYFLSEYELLLDSQFGFRSSRSCEIALANLSDNILTNMDNKLLYGLLLVDLKKAFDFVDHDTLLNFNFVSMVVLILPWLGFALIYPGVPRKPSLGAPYLKHFQSLLVCHRVVPWGHFSLLFI